MSVLVATDLVQSFFQGDKEIKVLKGLNLEVKKNETVAILGKSGIGKSTLLSLLTGLDHPLSGKVEIDGVNISQMSEKELTPFRAQNLAIVFQNFHLMSTLSALENVALPLEIRGDKDAYTKARKALEQVEMGHRLDHFPRQLSGGENQRVAMARALAQRPKILFADEPSGNLDEKTGAIVTNQLFDLVKKSHTTLVLVTHNKELANLCDRKLELTGGVLEHIDGQGAIYENHPHGP